MTDKPVALPAICKLSTGFDVQIKFHTEAAAVQTGHPEKVRVLIGNALDALGIEEEIDYTLEVRRTYGQ